MSRNPVPGRGEGEAGGGWALGWVQYPSWAARLKAFSSSFSLNYLMANPNANQCSDLSVPCVPMHRGEHLGA